MSNWKYNGDINLEHGGTFLRDDGGTIWSIEVVPAINMGGPDNVFYIIKGTVERPEGWQKGDDLFGEYSSPYEDCYIMIGKPDFKHDSGWEHDTWKDMLESGVFQCFRGDAKLKNIIRKGFFHY